MAKKGQNGNGQDRLSEAMALLIQNQAAFVAQLKDSDHKHLEFQRQHLEFERKNMEFERATQEQFAQIKAQMAEIIRVLNEHSRILTNLPEAVRDKIGFKPGQP